VNATAIGRRAEALDETGIRRVAEAEAWHLGVRNIDMPCTPEKVWRLLQTGNGS
jgi:hypothetical protein